MKGIYKKFIFLLEKPKQLESKFYSVLVSPTDLQNQNYLANQINYSS